MDRLSNLILSLEDELTIQCPRHVMSKQTIRNVLEILREATAERDRLAAENARLREIAFGIESGRKAFHDYSAANATLDRLREVVPEVLPPHMSWRDALAGARAILYPKETEHGN